MSGNFFKINCSINIEQLSEILRNSTYKLTFGNQAYRKTMLSKYEDGMLYLSYSGGALDGGGFEWFRSKVIISDSKVILIGQFEVLPQIRNWSRFFVLFSVISVIGFAIGDIVSAILPLIFVLVPILIAYKNLQKIFSNKSGREKIFKFIENELNGTIEEL